jgi:D-arabinose 1-dehydrogenase-like Zn-dependent alcohol dehydrogenase
MDVDGTFAEYVVVPSSSLVPVPAGVSDELAAIATDAIATAYHAARRGLVGPGRRVVVWGAGGLGLQAVGIARALGADHVIAVDPRADARDRAMLTGADEAVDPDAALAIVRSLGGADSALEFAGTVEAAALAVRSLTDGGRAVLVGAGNGHVDGGALATFAMREREIVGSYGSSRDELAEVLAMLASGALALPAAVGAIVPLDDIVDAVRLVRDGATGGARIVVDTTR